MFDTDRWEEIFTVIWMHKLRTALTALVLIIGIFSLIFLFGMGRGMANGTMHIFGKFATNTLFVWTERTTKEYKGFPAGKFVELNNQDTQALWQRFDEIEYMSPRLQLGNTKVFSDKEFGSFEVRGETPDLFNILPLEMEQGRFINQLDLKEKRKNCVIGTLAAETLFDDPEKAIGQYVQIRGIHFQVVGIQASSNEGDNGREDDMAVILPLSTSQLAFNQGNRVHYYAIALEEGVQSPIIEAEMKKMLRERHGVHPQDQRGVNSFNLSNEVAEMTGLFGAIDAFIMFVGIGFIIAGIAGIVNIMLIVVRERTREIGIRKSIGATAGSIMWMILVEAVVITALSTYTGMVIGVGTIALIDFLVTHFGVEGMFFRDPEVNFTLVFTAMFLMIFFGALAGLLPAYRAAKINPVEALSDE